MEAVMDKRLAAGAVAVGVVVAGVIVYQSLSDDEAPIRVRNGSIEIQAEQDPENEWVWEQEPNGDNVDSTPSYSHEPVDSYIDREKNLWVKVVRQTGACASGDKATGKTVRVRFSENNITVRFKRGRSGPWNYRTKVRRTTDLTPDITLKPPVLRHGTAGSGYITSVSVTGGVGDNDQDTWSCSFGNANGLGTIFICSSANKQACQ
jgi:hypothetical protein